MTLEKAIAHGKEHRKGYRERGKPGSFDRSCRPHGGCAYCQRARLFHQLREDAEVRDQMRHQQDAVL